jgi:5-formyltetrahydrofolate cyclo-ligase
MNPPAATSKAELRRVLRAALANIPPSERTEASAQARALLRRQTVWQEARSILFYAPMPAEPDVSPLLEEALATGKTVVLPRFLAETGAYEACQVKNLARDCAPGKFGITEPAAHAAPFPLKRLDFVLAPGLGFNLSGQRLGRGRGFYDRLLARISAPKCGVAFDSQVVGTIPAEAHDIHMNFILTPTRWLVIPS